jgi:light-regulated signal transduction histidine kinase (bacteriophytochrome)
MDVSTPATEALEQRLAATTRELDALGYGISHDLRAPLRHVSGFSQALLEDCGDQLDATGRDYLRRIVAGADRMAAMLDGLLELARLGRAELRREPVDLGALAAEAADELAATAGERSVRVRIAPSLVATGDPRLLRVLVGHLIGNAWKFTAHEPAAQIAVGAGEGEGFFVADNGVGFDMSQAERLFMPFQRLHPASQFPGTGIGLAAAQRIVHRHGGRIWADAATGEGATFTFTLPDRLEEAP